jgi:hypothetical protein
MGPMGWTDGRIKTNELFFDLTPDAEDIQSVFIFNAGIINVVKEYMRMRFKLKYDPVTTVALCKKLFIKRMGDENARFLHLRRRMGELIDDLYAMAAGDQIEYTALMACYVKYGSPAMNACLEKYYNMAGAERAGGVEGANRHRVIIQYAWKLYPVN